MLTRLSHRFAYVEFANKAAVDNALVLNGTELNGREIKVSAHNCARCPCRHVMCSLAVAPSRLFKSVCPRLLVAVVVAVVVAVAVVDVVADVAATAVVDVAVAGVAGTTAPATRRTEAQTSGGRVERRMLVCRVSPPCAGMDIVCHGCQESEAVSTAVFVRACVGVLVVDVRGACVLKGYDKHKQCKGCQPTISSL